MTIATGVARRVAYKAESAWGTAPGTGSAQILRRVSSDLSLVKDTYESQEIRADYQRADMRHGVRSIEGAIQGELSPGTYEDFLAAAVRQVFAAVSAISSLTLTIAASGSNWTITRSTGSWITDNIKLYNVVRITAGAFTAGNLNNNLFVLAETATVLTVATLNGSALTAEGPIGSATVSFPGKKAMAPLTAHTDASFAIEHWNSDVSVSELFLGLKLRSMGITLPPTGLAGINLGFLGKDVTIAGAAYYTTPTAETESGVLAAVNGVMAAQGSKIALLTGLSIELTGNHSAEAVVGSNTYADIAEGRILVNGQATVLFQDDTFLQYFDDETEVSFAVALAVSPANAADFMAFVLPRCKVGGASKPDGERSLVQTVPFTALLNVSGGAAATSEETTIAIQDSLA